LLQNISCIPFGDHSGISGRIGGVKIVAGAGFGRYRPRLWPFN
jgi:hypothetical protein